MPRIKKLLPALCAAVLIFSLLAVPALASGNVSGAIESTWKSAAGEIKTVVNNVVFPAIDLILAVLFFVKLTTAWLDYRKHGQFEFAGPAILFAGLVLSLTAPLYLWTILGI
ncbi:MAG: DUF3852 domain-containing protein [Oscillospiraceae bacterium]|nr:DUF3852 domain-containing protein [Oscillospiraceae bacterium]